MDKEKAPFWWPDAQGFVMGSVVLIVAIALFFRMGHPSAQEDKVLDMMLTILFGTAFVAIINYLFGSSRSSAAKDDTITKIALEPTTPQPPAAAAPAPAADPKPAG